MNFEQNSYLDTEDESEMGLNITPLIDVIFLLLIFFMVTTTFQNNEALSVDLPTASQGGKIDKQEIRELVITSDGKLHLDNKVIMVEALSDMLKQTPKASLIVRADTTVAHGKVVAALDAAKIAGINKISIATKSN
jgi:biopolymer transport protein ExbD